MLEEKLRRELRASLIKAGFDPYHPPDLPKDLQKKKGRPDLLVMGASMLIEVKRFTHPKKAMPTIHLSDISDPQRRFLDWWERRSRPGAGFPREGYIAIGTQGPWEGAKTRQCFVIPWLEWLNWEHQLVPDHFYKDDDSLMYAKSIQVSVLQVGNQFWKYEVLWKKDPSDRWLFGAIHPISINKYRHPHDDLDWLQLSLRFGEKEDNN